MPKFSPCVLALLPLLVIATHSSARAAVPNVFQPNTPISAAQMNENFAAFMNGVAVRAPQTFSANQTITVPPSVSKVAIEAIGGGGGSGGNTTNNTGFGANGGGGATVRQIVTVSPGDTLEMVVGGAGVGGLPGTTGCTSATAGDPGGATQVKRNGVIIANALGGGGGQAPYGTSMCMIPTAGAQGIAGPGSIGAASVTVGHTRVLGQPAYNGSGGPQENAPAAHGSPGGPGLVILTYY